MAKGFTFGVPKQQPKKETKSDNTSIDITGAVNTYIDKNLETIDQLEDELGATKKAYNLLVTAIADLDDELLTKNTSIQGYNQTIESLSTKIVELTERNYDLEEAQKQKITAKTPLPKGFRPAINDETIAQIREYAKSILPKKGTIKFYEEIGKKFNIASGSAYKYCREIYQNTDSSE